MTSKSFLFGGVSVAVLALAACGGSETPDATDAVTEIGRAHV